jgi:ribosomal protein S21
MALEVSLHDGESQESLIRRFQKSVQMEGVLREFKASQTFLNKRELYIAKSRRAAKRNRFNK